MARIFSVVLASAAVRASQAETIKIGMDTNYPPYAQMDENGSPSGFGYEVAMGMNAMCDDVDIEVVVLPWSDCWTGAGGGAVGKGIEDGTVHGCMTYSHTHGVRDNLCDFSDAMLNDNKAAGLLAMLDESGVPTVRGFDDLDGVTVVDVGGWAPTADTIAMVTNKCSDMMYSPNVTVVTVEENDPAMTYLQEGKAHAMFVYADQAEQYKCSDSMTTTPTWDCDLWAGLGTKYAYVQTGQFGHAVNGTTLVLSKKGSGVPALIDPCLQKFLKTKEYYDACVKYGLEAECFQNEFFTGGAASKYDFEYNLDTDQHVGDCMDGYCPCKFECPFTGMSCGDAKAAYKSSGCCGSPASPFMTSRRLSSHRGSDKGLTAEVQSALKEANKIGGVAAEKKLEQKIRDALKPSTPTSV